MISYIKGTFVDLVGDTLILESNQIGYNIRIPLSNISQLPDLGKEVKIFTYLYVREDAINLYGFLKKDDLDVFKLLISVSGIGPKGALGILSGLSSDELRFAILAEDAKTLSKAPGVGVKTAKRLIIELKDKITIPAPFEESSKDASAPDRFSMNNGKQEALEALTALGYSGAEALRAVKEITITEEMDSESILREALKKMSIL